MRDVRRVVVYPLALVFVCVNFAGAQEAPEPGPEHARLGFWVGNWTNEGEVKENSMMPAGKMTSKDRCDWFEGGFAVVCHTEGTGPMGPGKSVGIMSYSVDAKAYTYYGTDSMGMAMTTVPLGQVDGKTWVFNDESMMGGAMTKTRFTMVETSPTSYTFKWEMQGEDGEWATIMEGKGKKS